MGHKLQLLRLNLHGVMMQVWEWVHATPAPFGLAWCYDAGLGVGYMLHLHRHAAARERCGPV